RGRLFLGIGGRDHFGIRGRIASEFASCRPSPPIPLRRRHEHDRNRSRSATRAAKPAGEHCHREIAAARRDQRQHI
ncbi:hypothetical protein GOC51_04890, partial [Sinorhizobium meliloti]|nr:hypothetical protein [Sinorhizobium meliloti]